VEIEKLLVNGDDLRRSEGRWSMGMWMLVVGSFLCEGIVKAHLRAPCTPRRAVKRTRHSPLVVADAAHVCARVCTCVQVKYRSRLSTLAHLQSTTVTPHQQQNQETSRDGCDGSVCLSENIPLFER
jgi:hypothetical protein